MNRIFVTFFMSLWAVGAWAQTALDSIQHLDEVEVVGTRYREVTSPQRLSGKSLEALGHVSVADAVRYFSGVQIKDYGGIGGLKTVDVRSMGTTQTGVFYDGIQLGNAQNGTVDLGKFSLDNLEEISLYNGQKSDIFQPAKDFASANSIYLRTRRPRFEENKLTNLRALFRTGSFGLANPSALWEQKWNDRLSSSFSTEYTTASGKYKFHRTLYNNNGNIVVDTVAVRQNGEVRALRVEGGLNGRLEQGWWNAKAYFYDSERGIPGAIVRNVWKSPAWQADRNFFAQGSWQQQFSEHWEALVNAKYANDWLRYRYRDESLNIDNSFRQQEFYASLANKYELLRNWQANLSVDYQYNTLESVGIPNFPAPERHTALAALATVVEFRRFKAQASLLGSFVFDQTEKSRSDRQEYTPALFFSYKPFGWRNLQLTAFYKRIFRMPTFNELYYTDIGFPNLRPEFATQYNVGIQYQKRLKSGFLRRMEGKAEIYFNRITDKIVAKPRGNGQYRWEMMNIGTVEVHGLNLSGQATFGLPAQILLHATAQYSYQRAQDFSNPQSEFYGGQIAYTPLHSSSLTLWVERGTWDTHYSFIYVGERYENSANIPVNREPAWLTHDLTIGKTFAFKPIKELKISAEVNNLFNQQYDVVHNYPMPGRNYKISLIIHY